MPHISARGIFDCSSSQLFMDIERFRGAAIPKEAFIARGPLQSIARDDHSIREHFRWPGAWIQYHKAQIFAGIADNLRNRAGLAANDRAIICRA
jgi:hypothetical protein